MDYLHAELLAELLVPAAREERGLELSLGDLAVRVLVAAREERVELRLRLHPCLQLRLRVDARGQAPPRVSRRRRRVGLGLGLGLGLGFGLGLGLGLGIGLGLGSDLALGLARLLVSLLELGERAWRLGRGGRAVLARLEHRGDARE